MVSSLIFYGTIPALAAEWLGKEPDDLDPNPTCGLREWGFDISGAQYKKFIVGPLLNSGCLLLCRSF
jgi:hypothetical protein